MSRAIGWLLESFNLSGRVRRAEYGDRNRSVSVTTRTGDAPCSSPSRRGKFSTAGFGVVRAVDSSLSIGLGLLLLIHFSGPRNKLKERGGVVFPGG